VEEDTAAEQVVATAAIQGTLDQLQAMDGAFDRALAPRQDNAVVHRVKITAKAVREGLPH